MSGRVVGVVAGLALVLMVAGAAAWLVLAPGTVPPPVPPHGPAPVTDPAVAEVAADADDGPARRHVSGAGDESDDDVEIVERGPDGLPTKAQRIRWINEWMEVLGDRSYAWRARNEAVTELVKFPLDELLPIVMRTVEGNEEARIGWAFHVLYRLGERMDPVAERVAALLDGESEWIADCAGRALATMGEKGEPFLLDALESERARMIALEHLYRAGALSGAAAPRLLKLVDDEDPETRSAALRALGDVEGAEALVVPALIAGLRDDDPDVRFACLVALATQRDRAAAALPEIRRLLDDADDVTRVWAISALERLGPAAIGDAARITDLLPTTARRFRPRVRSALIAMGSDAYLQGFGHDNAEVRIDLLDGVGDLLEEHPDAASSVVASLVDLLADADAAVRAEAASRLGSLADEARGTAATATRLRAAVDDKDPRVVRAAIVALTRVAGATADVLDILLRELREGAPDERAAAARALGEVGPEAATPELVNALADALDDNASHVRRRAAEALETMGDAASSAASSLGARLNDPEPAVRIAAALALMAVDPPGIAAKDTVQELRLDDLRERLMRGLGRHPNALWLPVLEDRMTDRDSRVKRAAIESAARYGALAAPLLDTLVDRLRNDRDWNVRSSAVHALSKLGPDLPEAAAALEEFRNDPKWGRWVRIILEQQPER